MLCILLFRSGGKEGEHRGRPRRATKLIVAVRDNDGTNRDEEAFPIPVGLMDSEDLQAAIANDAETQSF